MASDRIGFIVWWDRKQAAAVEPIVRDMMLLPRRRKAHLLLGSRLQNDS